MEVEGRERTMDKGGVGVTEEVEVERAAEEGTGPGEGKRRWGRYGRGMW